MFRDERLSPDRRVRRRRDFLRIQSSRKKYRSKHFLLALVPHRDSASESGQSSRISRESRLGITVTRKVDKRAARRNRLKRRIREYFRKERSDFRFPLDLVVIALSDSVQLDYVSVQKELRFLLQKARVLTPLKSSGSKNRKPKHGIPK